MDTIEIAVKQKRNIYLKQERKEKAMDRIFLDTETTGLTPGQIGQLAVICEKETGEVLVHNYFFEVGYVEDGAARVTGRNKDWYSEASGGLKFADKASEISQLLAGGTLIGHNLPFDEKFLSAEFWRAGVGFTPINKMDTMEYFTNICKIPKKKYGRTGNAGNGKEYKYPKLEELADFLRVNKDVVKKFTENLFNTDLVDFHDARFDTTILFVAFHVYKDMLDGTNGWIDTFCHNG